MRLYLSVSGHSSEWSVSYHSSRPTVSQLKCLQHYIKLIWESPTPEDKNLHCHWFTLLSFKTRIKWPLGWPQPQVFRGYFFNSCKFQGNVQAFRLTGLLWWQKLTWSFQHFLQVFQISQFHFAFAVSFHPREVTLESGLTVAWFFSTNHNSLLRTVTNEIASFCIDNRLRQMAFFCLRQRGQRRRLQRSAFPGRLSRYVEIFWNKKGFLLLYKKNRFQRLGYLTKFDTF